jgi:hypothetical protein
MKNTSNYQIKTEDDRLVFTTSSFRAEKTSVLHSGVYTKEFSSMLFASAVSVFAHMAIISVNINIAVFRYLIIVFTFVVSFLGANKFIFKEKHIEVILDKSEKNATITRYGIIIKKTEKIPFSNIKSVELGSRKFVPENIDGIEFVQRISAQHGSAMPELSNEEEFITLSLNLTDGSDKIIYAGKIDGGKVNGEPSVPLNEIRSFLNK